MWSNNFLIAFISFLPPTSSSKSGHYKSNIKLLTSSSILNSFFISKMQPIIRFYDLPSPSPWSPKCWNTRYVLNYGEIPYTTIQVPFSEIKSTCERLFIGVTGWQVTIPIIEIIVDNKSKVLNDSTPTAEFLEKLFPAEKGS